MTWDFFGEERKKTTIKNSVKADVYDRAKGKCEKCGKKLKFNEGHYHHTRSDAKTSKGFRFLCPDCHYKYGHSRKVTKDAFFGNETKVVRKQVTEVKGTKKNSVTKSKSSPKKKRKPRDPFDLW